MEKKLNRVASLNLLSTVVLNGIQFFTLPIFTRLLGTGNYGRVSLYLTWVNVLTVILSLQVSGTITIADVHLPEAEQKGYRSSINAMSLLFSVIVFSLVFFFKKPLSNIIQLSQVVLILCVIHSYGKACISFLNAKYTYYKEAEKNFILSVGVSIVSVITSYIFITQIGNYDAKYMGYICGIALPNIVVGLGALFIIFKEGKVFFNKKYWKFCITLCVPLIFHGLAHLIMSQSDRVMLQAYKTDDVVGIYSLAVNFGLVINILWGAFNNTWVPFYFEDLKNQKLDKVLARGKNYIRLFTILTCGFILLSPEVFRVFADKSFWGGITLIPVVAVSYYFVFLYSFPVNFQFFHKKTINIAIGTGVSAVINIILNMIFIPKYSGMGAAVATLIAHVFLFILHHLIAKKIDRTEYNFSMKIYAPEIGFVLMISVCFYVLKEMPLIRWGIGIILGIYMLRRLAIQKNIF